MSQLTAFPSQRPAVRGGIKQMCSSQSERSDAQGSTSPHSYHDTCSLLKSNCVIALSSLATGGEGRFYAVRCMVAGVWSLQMQAGLQPYDPSVQLVVVNQNGKLGFRSAIAGGRLLCCNRQYHLGFEHWEMDYQEAWSLQGSSLSNCTLRNEMHKLTLNIRITVLAEPTDLLGNPRITSALIASSGSNSTAAQESNGASSYVKLGSEQAGRRLSDETLRLFLAKPGSEAKVSNPFTRQRESLNPQDLKRLSTDSSRTGVSAKAFFLPTKNPQRKESGKTFLARSGGFTFASCLKMEPSQSTGRRSQSCSEERKPDSHRVSLNSSGTGWKPTTPSRNESQVSSFSMTSMFDPESQSGANLQAQNGHSVLETMTRTACTSETPRKVRKWKRNSDGIQNVSSVDQEGNNIHTAGLKRSQVPMFIDVTHEDGALLSPGNSDESISAGGGSRSPRVVIKRQPGFLGGVEFDLPPRTPHFNPKGTAHENSGEKVTCSKTQLDDALDNLRKDAERQEREKVIHWKLQAAVRLLKTETEQKLTFMAKAAFEEAYARTFRENLKGSSWLLKDVSRVKRSVSPKLQRKFTPTTTNIASDQNKRQWTYPPKRVFVKEEEVSLALSQKRRRSCSRLQMLLELWFFLPVPLLSLAYVTLLYRRKKKSEA